MTTRHRPVFVTLDGPGGTGKSTTTEYLHRYLTAQGYTVHSTTEPSHGPLGKIARRDTDIYTGHALACLVAADRYHHLDTEIRPRLATGSVVVCDRYVASSYVLQRMDGVPIQFIELLNAAADVPDLAVILTAEPTVTAHRIELRGAHSRFEDGLTTSQTEVGLYQDTITRLTERGYPVLTIDTTDTPAAQVVAVIAARITALAGVPPADTVTA